MAMSCAKCRPSQFFLKACDVALPASSPTLHFLSTHEPDSQSAFVSQAGAASQVPSLHSKPSLHSVELSQATPQSLLPRALELRAQPGNSGGHSSLGSQRTGASAPGYAGGASVLVSLVVNSIGLAFEPKESTLSPAASLART